MKYQMIPDWQNNQTYKTLKNVNDWAEDGWYWSVLLVSDAIFGRVLHVYCISHLNW